MTDTPRYRLDDLRRFAAALGAGSGMTRSRSAALAAHLSWYDESGFAPFGLAALPGWLDRMADGQVDPCAEGKVVSETQGTAVLDGQRGLPPLILVRAAELAVEKSRDSGIGLVRVLGIDRAGPAAAVVATVAQGPNSGAVIGPGGSLALALPAEEGPAIFDSALASLGDDDALSRAVGPWAPWLLAMVPDGGYLVGVIAVKAVEPLTTVHERVGSMMKTMDEGQGRLVAYRREIHRREAREHGVAVTTETWTRLRQWAERFGLALPPPASTATAIAHAPGGAG